jgi:cobalt transporter subunit CbtB
MRNHTATVDQTAAPEKAVAWPLQLIGGFLLGSIILYGAGFLSTAAVHNAAHDTRHSQGFPCH